MENYKKLKKIGELNTKYLDKFNYEWVRIYQEKTPSFLFDENGSNIYQIIKKTKNIADVFKQLDEKINLKVNIQLIVGAYIFANITYESERDEIDYKSDEEIRRFMNNLVKKLEVYEEFDKVSDKDLKVYLDEYTSIYERDMSIGKIIYDTNLNIQETEAIPYTISNYFSEKKYEILINERSNEISSEKAAAEEVKKKKLTVDEGDDFFQKCRLTSSARIIIHTDHFGKQLFKLYNEKTESKIVNWNPIEIALFSEYQENSLVIFYNVNQYVIDLNEGTIVLKASDPFLKELDDIFPPGTSLNEIKDSQEKVSSTISFKDVSISSYGLFNSIINGDIISKFLYVNERTHPWASNDTNFNIKYKDFNPLHFPELNISYSEKDYVSLILPFSTDEKTIGLSFTIVARNREIYDIFIYRLPRFITLTLQESRIFNDLFSSVTSFKSKKTLGATKAVIYSSKISALKEQASELFTEEKKIQGVKAGKGKGTGYTTDCQCPVQPIIIDRSEVKDWEDYGRKIRIHPPPKEGVKSYHFVCPMDKFPNLHYIPNKLYQVNKEGYRWNVCCVKNEVSEQDIYDNFYNLDWSPEDGKAKSTTIKTEKFLNNQDGELPTTLREYLMDIYPDKDISLYKHGFDSILNPNSIILALERVRAIERSHRIDTKISQSRIRDIRRRLTENLDISRQELYDWTDEQIISYLLDDTKFLDPYLFYRLLEEHYNVNILVFSDRNPISAEQKNLADKETDKQKQPSLQIPRHYLLHVRNFDIDRPLLIVLENSGSERGRTPYPQCEIISIKHNKTLTFTFNDNEFKEKLIEYYNKISSPLLFIPDDTSNSGFKTYQNLFNHTNWEKSKFFKSLGSIKGQEIDLYGHCRVLIFNEWVIYVPPSQPLNVSINIKKPPLKTKDEVRKVFDTSDSIEEDDGFWLSFYGFKKGIFIPTQSSKRKSTGETTDVIVYISDIMHTLNNTSAFMQIINWLWRTRQLEVSNAKDISINRNIPSFQEWWDSNINVQNNLDTNRDPIFKLNNRLFSSLPSIDGINNLDEMRINQLNFWWPSFFKNGKIMVTSELYTIVLGYFNRQQIMSDLIDEKYIYPPRGIYNLELLPEYLASSGDIILSERKHVEDWLKYQKMLSSDYISYYNSNIIYNKIFPIFRDSEDVFLLTLNGGIYVVQNTINEKANALYIAYIWRESSKTKNIGSKRHIFDYNSEIIDDMYNENYVMYYVDEIYQLQITEVNKKQKNHDYDYLEIVSYGTKFAALLPL